jgi:hypothetical protein
MFESFLHNKNYSIFNWIRNLFKHKDDGYTNTEGESHKYTSLMEESVKLGEESYAFIDKNPPHLVLEHIDSHPNFDDDEPLIPKRLPKSMKQRFQEQQYKAFFTKDSIDTPSNNTRSKKRRKLSPVFKNCLTQSPIKTYKNRVKLPKSYKNALTTPQNKTFNNSKKGGETKPQ